MNSVFPDRYWWLHGVQGGVSALLGLCTLVWLISHVQGGGTVRTETWVVFSIIGVLCWSGSILSTLRALEARRWWRARLQTMQGNPDAMPLAALSSDASHAPQLGSGTVSLLWHSTPAWRHTWTGVHLFLYLFLTALTGGGVCVVSLLFSKNVWALSVELVVTILIAGVMIVGSLFGLFVLSRQPIKPNTVHGMVATAEGMVYYPPVGKTQFLRWEGIRLFEVVGTGSWYHHRYRLYGPKVIAEWSDLPRPPWELDAPKMTRAELQAHHQDLLNLIVARTHLLPRTLDKRLVRHDEQ